MHGLIHLSFVFCIFFLPTWPVIKLLATHKLSVQNSLDVFYAAFAMSVKIQLSLFSLSSGGGPNKTKPKGSFVGEYKCSLLLRST